MSQVNGGVCEKNPRWAQHGLHRDCEHLLIGRMNVEPLIRADLELILIDPNGDVLEGEPLLQAFNQLSHFDILSCLV